MFHGVPKSLSYHISWIMPSFVTNQTIFSQEVRMSASEGIAGQVVQTGKILNIKDAYSHPLFYRGVDETTGFRTKSILCFPIKDEKGKLFAPEQQTYNLKK